MTVRPWTDADTDALWAWSQVDPDLWEQIGLSDRSRAALDARIAAYRAEVSAAWCAAVESDGALVGFVGIRPRWGAFGAVHLIVAPTARGAGQAIAAHGIRAAHTALGMRTLVAAPMTGCSPAVQTRWLARLGFQPRPSWVLEL